MSTPNFTHLDVLVRNVDFRRLDDPEFSEFDIDDLIRECADHTHSRKQVEDTFLGIRKHVSRTDFPGKQSSTYEALDSILHKLRHALNDAVDAEVESERYTEADLVPQLRDIFYTCLQHGPTLGHMQFLDMIIRGFELRDHYIKKLTGDEAKKFLEALKVTYNPNAMEMSEDQRSEYDDRLENFYSDMFYRHICDDSEELLVEYSPWMAPLLLHYLRQMGAAPTNDIANIFCRISCQLLALYSSGKPITRHLFCRLGDPQSLLDHLNQFRLFVADGTFAKHQCFEDIREKWLEMLMVPLKEKVEYGAANVQAYTDLLVVILDSENPSVTSLLSSIVHVFYDLDPKITKNCSISCDNLARLIEKAPQADERRQRSLREAAKCFVGHKFSCGEVAEGSFSVLTALLRTGVESNCSCVYDILRKGEKLKWKNRDQELQLVLKAAIETSIQLGPVNSWNFRSYASVAKWVTERAEKAKIVKTLNSDLIQGMLSAMSHTKEYPVLIRTMYRAVRAIDWKLDLTRLHEAYSAFMKALEENGSTLTIDANSDYISLMIDFLSGASSAIKESGAGAGEFVDDVVKGMTATFTAVKQALEDEDDYLTQMYTSYTISFLAVIPQMCENPDHIKPLLPIMFTIAEDDVENLSRTWSFMFSLVGQKQPAVLDEHVPRLVKLACDAEPDDGANLSAIFYLMYPHGAAHYHAELEKILQHAQSSGNTNWVGMVLQLVNKIADKNPEAVTASHMRQVTDMIGLSRTNLLVYSVVDKVASHSTAVVLGVLELLVSKAYGGDPEGQPFVIRTLGHVAKSSQDDAEKRAAQLLKLFPATQEVYCGVNLVVLKEVAAIYPTALAPHKDTVLEIKAKFPVHTEKCDHIIDLIEGRSLAGLSEDVEEQKADLEVVKTDVSDTKQKVDDVSTKVDEQGRDLKHVQEDVTKVEERLDVVEETVDDTVQKVEEVDKKTMTNAPAWSRDVSLLLNPESDRDWRLLGQRLGYSKDDIRGWATQHDPCMAVLSEWYATHKTREATHGVLKALEEMNREDAVEIVRKAKEEGDAVLEEEEEDSGPLPPIFLSYQWGHQPHVKLLKRHLEKAGFRCWMDTGQMGGGDKLFAKIDAGMRAATVIICCVSEKYAKSDNCTREVNLAVNLGKPIIPLLMEKMKWPPEGAMGPIFGEYLFIRLNQRSGEETGDERFWPAAKFEELIMQLRYSIVPDKTMITEEYREWWNPKDEQFAIPKTSENRAISEVPAENSQEQPKSPEPEVFLSYQWGKQTQIKALFTRLTSLGYSCWMDIHQMGGGDSLYEKIDKGVRNAKVVVCCVTPKYALSANCRREVSLADALKKPIVPLLLDKMTWPPEGPMSMVLTQLLYVGFSDNPEIQLKWTGGKMDELIQKINQHVPIMIEARSPEPQSVQPDEDSKPTSKVLKVESHPPSTGPSTVQENPKTRSPEPQSVQPDEDSKPTSKVLKVESHPPSTGPSTVQENPKTRSPEPQSVQPEADSKPASKVSKVESHPPSTGPSTVQEKPKTEKKSKTCVII